jgi:hypothetical protein
VPDLPAQLASPQTAAAFVTTEHFVLQTARAATIAEANGRASVFLGVVSGALVALGFAGQAGPGGRVLLGFGLALFPVLLFLGVATYARVLQLSLEDIVLLWRIDRIRRLYLDANPGLAGILAPAWSGGQAVPRVQGIHPGRWRLLLTMAGTIGVVNSVLAGALAGFAASLLSGHTAVRVLAGVVAFAIVAAAHQRHQRSRFANLRSPLAQQDHGAGDSLPDQPADPGA